MANDSKDASKTFNILLDYFRSLSDNNEFRKISLKLKKLTDQLKDNPSPELLAKIKQTIGQLELIENQNASTLPIAKIIQLLEHAKLVFQGIPQEKNKKFAFSGVSDKRRQTILNSFTEQDIQFVKDNYLQLSDNQLSEQLDQPRYYIIFLRSYLELKRPMINYYKRLDPKNIQYIKKHYGEKSDTEIAQELGLEAKHVLQIRNRLGLRKPRRRKKNKLTAKQLEFLKNNFPEKSDQELAAYFKIKVDALKKLRSELGLYRQGGHQKANPSKEQLKFLRKNYKKMSDEELAKKLGYTKWLIRNIRYEQGLFLPRGLLKKGETKSTVSLSKDQEKFIAENYQKFTDQQIADKLKVKKNHVTKTRKKLGLDKQRGINPNQLNRKTRDIDKDSLSKMLNLDGLNQVDVAKILNVSRERVRQIVDKLGVVVDPQPIWYARKFKIPQLADKKWLISQLTKTRSLQKLAEQLNTTYGILKTQLTRLGINYQQYTGAKQIETSCEVCGKKIIKSHAIAKRCEHHFCGKECQGIWLSQFGFKPGHHKITWTKADLDYIKNNYQQKTDAEMALVLNKSLSSVSQKRRQLRLLAKKYNSWTTEQDQFLLDNFNTLNKREIAQRLGRSYPAITARYYYIKNTKDGN